MNWCDWAYLEYSLGNFLITAGKQVITFGGFELEEYDFDVHLDMMSGLFNNFQCYQWGGKFGWMNNSESTGFFLQATGSPYGEKPFDRMTYSLQYQGNYGPFSMLYSTNLVGNWGNGYEWMFTLGNKLELDAWTLGLDVSNKVGDGCTVDFETIFLFQLPVAGDFQLSHTDSLHFEVGRLPERVHLHVKMNFRRIH